MSTTVNESKRHLEINATEFDGQLDGTIKTNTTATTQSAGDNSTKVATTAYADAVLPSWVPTSNPNYLTGINSSQVTNALGFTPYNATNPSNYITGYTVTQGDVTGHQAALSITESQITDLQSYLTAIPSGYATESYVQTQITNLVDSAPSTLNTLDELASALGDDANFATTIATSIGTKLPLAAGSGSPLTGDLYLTLSGSTQRALSSTGTNSMQIGDAGTQMLRFKNASGSALDIAASGSATFADNIIMGSGKTVDGVDISALPTSFAPTNADATPSWVPATDPSYLTSSSTQSKYLRSDTSDTATGYLTLSGGVTGSNSLMTSFFLPQNPEGSHVKAPWFFNDMAYARLRGATISVTVNGGSSPSNANIDAMFDAATGFWNMSTSGVTSVVIEMTNPPKSMQHGAHYGVTFGNSHWRAKNVDIDAYYSSAYQEVVSITGNTKEFIYGAKNSSGNSVSKIRWTFSDFNTTSMRIVSLFAYNYNATGMPSLYLAKDGGEMYGDIDMGTNTITDTKVGQWDTSYTHSQSTHAPTNADATPSWVPSSNPNYLTSVPAQTWASITGKPSTFTPSAHNQAWSTITSTPTTISGYGITDAFDGAYGSLTGTPTLPTDFVSAANGGTFSGDIQSTGIYVGSTNTSYDFYNNGTTYLNGAVTVDDNLAMNNKNITGVNEIEFDDGFKLFGGGNNNYLKAKAANTANGGIIFQDGDSETMGYIYWDGASTANFGFLDATGTWAVRCRENEWVRLHYDNAIKLSTKSDGVDITGELQCDTLDVDGNADITGTLTINGTNTFLIESNSTAATFNLNSGARGFDFINNNATLLSLSSGGVATFAGDLTIPGYINHAGDSGTKFGFEGNDAFRLYTDSTMQLQIDSSGDATFAGTIGSGAITSTGKIQGTELEGTSLDINGNGNLSGTLTIPGGWATTILDGDNVVVKKPNYSGGGWARALMNFKEHNDTSLYAIGAYGSNNTFSYGYIGTAYNNTTMRWAADKTVTFGGNVTAGSNSLTAGSLDIDGATDIAGALDVHGAHIRAHGGDFILEDDNSNNIHFRANSNSTEGVIRLNNGANWGLIARGVSNSPRLGAYHNGTLDIYGYGASDGADHANDINLAQFDFGNTRFNVNGEIRGDSLDIDGNVDISGNIVVSGTVDGVDISALPTSFFDGAYGSLSGVPSTFTPSSHTHTFGSLTSKPTTLAGYGITDASTTTAMNSAISTAVANLVDSSPAALDTLNELAAAIGDDANFSTTIATSIGTKLPLVGGTLSGNTFVNAQLAVNSTTVNAANKLEVHGQARVDGTMMIGDSSISNTVNAAAQLHIKNTGQAAIRLEDSDNNNLAFDLISDEGVGFVIKETVGGDSGDDVRLTIAESTGNATFSGTVTANGTTLTGTQTTVSGSSGSCTGNAASVTNGVYTTGNQTIGGNKTFSGQITANNSIYLEDGEGVYITGQTYPHLMLSGDEPTLSSGQGDTCYLSDNVRVNGDLTVNGGDITLNGTGKITGIDTVTAATHAANKSYVDTQVATRAASSHTHAYNTLTGIPSTFTPSSHTHTFSSITSKPTTISGYGITDAFDGAYNSLSGRPTIPSGNQIIDWTASGAGTIHANNYTNTTYTKASFDLDHLFDLVGAAADTSTNMGVYTSGTVPPNQTIKQNIDALSARKENFIVACSDETSDLTTGTAKVTFRIPYAMQITNVRASVTTAAASGIITVDINLNGNSIFGDGETGTRLTIDSGERTSTTAATAYNFVSSATQVTFGDDAEVSIDIDTVGTESTGKGLKVTLIGYQR